MGTLVLPILYYPSYKKGVGVWVHWYFLYCITPLIKKEWGYGYTGTSYIVLPSYKKGVGVWVHWYFLYCITPLIKKEWGYGYTGTSYIVLPLL